MTANFGDGDSGVATHLPQSLSTFGTDPANVKCVCFEIPNTSDGGATFTFPLSRYGITNLVDVWVFEHTTTDSVIISSVTAATVTEFTSAVSAGVATITFRSGAINVKRVVIAWGV